MAMNPEPRDLLRGSLLHELLHEVGSTLGVIAAFVAFALGSSVGLRWLGVDAPPEPYLESTVSDSTPPADARPTLWLVDGFNVLHVVLLHGESREAWWQSKGRERVVELARAFDAPEAEVVVVFDGSQPPPAGETGDATGPRVIFAAPADDWLLTAVRNAPDPARVAVVTADRRLAARARHRGAQVVAPGAFAQRCRAANS
jgi:predicted RNA-binding protein with PIN domain